MVGSGVGLLLGFLTTAFLLSSYMMVDGGDVSLLIRPTIKGLILTALFNHNYKGFTSKQGPAEVYIQAFSI